jgi:hypothetical protein
MKLPGFGNPTVTQEPTLHVHGMEVIILPPKGTPRVTAEAQSGVPSKQINIVTKTIFFMDLL